jgi:hypothetical protein
MSRWRTYMCQMFFPKAYNITAAKCNAITRVSVSFWGLFKGTDALMGNY